MVTRYGSGLYHQIEVFDDPDFYHNLSYKLQEEPSVDVSLPLYKLEGIPQIIEITLGVLTAIKITIELYKLTKPSKIQIRTRENKIIELKAENIDELLIWAEENTE